MHPNYFEQLNDLRHAVYYLKKLETYNQLFASSGDKDNAGFVVQMFNRDSFRPQLESAQKRATHYSRFRTRAAVICSQYPLRGANLLAVCLPPSIYIRWIKDAIKASQLLGDILTEVKLWDLLGITYNRSGDFQASITCFEKALSLVHTISNLDLEASILDHMAVTNAQRGNYAQAVTFWESQLETTRKDNKLSQTYHLLINIATAQHFLTDYAQALNKYREALTLLRKVHDKKNESIVLKNIGDCLVPLGDYENAINHVKEALEIARRIGNSDLEQDCQSDLGGIYLDQGRIEESHKAYSRAFDLAERKTENRKYLGMCWGNLGSVDIFQGNYVDAVSKIAKALEIAVEIHDKLYIGVWLKVLGQLALDAGLYSQALCLLENASIVLEVTGAKDELVSILLIRSTMSLSQNNLIDAESYVSRAIKLAQDIGYKKYIALAILAETEILRRKNQFNFALQNLQTANEIFVSSSLKEKVLAESLYSVLVAQLNGTSSSIQLLALAEAEISQGQLTLAIIHTREAESSISRLNKIQTNFRRMVEDRFNNIINMADEYRMQLD